MGGSNGFKEYIKNNCLNKGLTIKHLSKCRGQTFAIDISGWIYRGKHHSGQHKWWLQFINFVHKLSKYNIKIIIVFDGKPDIEKEYTIETRKSKQIKYMNKHLEQETETYKQVLEEQHLEQDTNRLNNSKSININDIKLCKKICNKLGIPYIHIESLEADYIFKYLIDNKIANCVLTQDNDMFRLGCKKVFFDLDYNLDNIYIFDYDECLFNMNITIDQFNNAYDASGTDFNSNLEYCKFKETIELMKIYNTIENVIDNLHIINKDKLTRIIKVPKRFNYIMTREIFNRPLSDKVIKQLKYTISSFQSIFDNILINIPEYSKQLFNDIESISGINEKEKLKYIGQVKDYCKNVYNIYL